MATTREIRLARFKELLATLDNNQAKMAAKLEVAPAYINQILAPKGDARRRNIGDQAAAKIEKAFGLPEGWMDKAENGVKQNTGTYQINVGGKAVQIMGMQEQLVQIFQGLSEHRQNALFGAAHRLWEEEHQGSSAANPFPQKPKVPNDH